MSESGCWYAHPPLCLEGTVNVYGCVVGRRLVVGVFSVFLVWRIVLACAKMTLRMHISLVYEGQFSLFVKVSPAAI